MEKKKISFSELVNVLSLQEMKIVTGGSGKWCYCDGQNQWVKCTTASDCGTRICPDKGSDCW